VPSTISELFAAADLKPEGCVRWGQPVPERKTGVYVVSLTPETDEMAGTLSRCPLNDAALRELLSVRPELRMDDDKRPSAAELGARLAAFGWPMKSRFTSGGRASRCVSALASTVARGLGRRVRTAAGGS
jgi:hypothetical protein